MYVASLVAVAQKSSKNDKDNKDKKSRVNKIRQERAPLLKGSQFPEESRQFRLCSLELVSLVLQEFLFVCFAAWKKSQEK